MKIKKAKTKKDKKTLKIIDNIKAFRLFLGCPDDIKEKGVMTGTYLKYPLGF